MFRALRSHSPSRESSGSKKIKNHLLPPHPLSTALSRGNHVHVPDCNATEPPDAGGPIIAASCAVTIGIRRLNLRRYATPGRPRFAASRHCLVTAAGPTFRPPGGAAGSHGAGPDTAAALSPAAPRATFRARHTTICRGTSRQSRRDSQANKASVRAIDGLSNFDVGPGVAQKHGD